MTAGEIKFKIVYHIYRYGPKSISQLAKSMHMSRQKIHYNVTQLIKEGVLVKTEDGKYALQPLFTEEPADIYFKFINLMTDVLDYLILPDDVDPGEAMISNFEYYVLLNLESILRLKKGGRNEKRMVDS